MSGFILLFVLVLIVAAIMQHTSQTHAHVLTPYTPIVRHNQPAWPALPHEALFTAVVSDEQQLAYERGHVYGYASTGQFVSAATAELWMAACDVIEYIDRMAATSVSEDEILGTPVIEHLISANTWARRANTQATGTVPVMQAQADLSTKIEAFVNTLTSEFPVALDCACGEPNTHEGYCDARVAEHQAYVIEHAVSSTERMRDLRVSRYLEGLTARGTVPQPVCKGTTKAGTACKRKAQHDGHGFCSLEHALASVSA